MLTLRLHGEIHRSEGHYVSRCHELDTVTAAETIEQVLDSTADMIALYFETCAKQGSLESELARLLTGQQAPRFPAGLDIETDFKLAPGDRRIVGRQHVDLNRAA